MKGSNIVSAVHHLKLAQEHFEDFVREHEGSKGAKLFRNYSSKIKWIHTDLITHPFLPESVRLGIKQEVNSDVLAIPAINEKIALLNPTQREAIETAIDQILDGKLEIINK
ncbi:MAG TPA: hypothetical protein VIM07_15030 [Chitinophagaceae bacterium]